MVLTPSELVVDCDAPNPVGFSRGGAKTDFDAEDISAGADVVAPGPVPATDAAVATLLRIKTDEAVVTTLLVIQ